jgi:hypothetical protein
MLRQRPTIRHEMVVFIEVLIMLWRTQTDYTRAYENLDLTYTRCADMPPLGDLHHGQAAPRPSDPMRHPPWQARQIIPVLS